VKQTVALILKDREGEECSFLDGNMSKMNTPFLFVSLVTIDS